MVRTNDLKKRQHVSPQDLANDKGRLTSEDTEDRQHASLRIVRRLATREGNQSRPGNDPACPVPPALAQPQSAQSGTSLFKKSRSHQVIEHARP